MTLSEILAWLGLLATILFGGASIYLVIRRRYPGRLAFVVQKEIALFEDVVRNLPELSVNYDGKPVSDTLVLLRAIVLNVGDRDITPDKVGRPLELHLPEGFAWRTARIVRASDDVKATAHITDPQRLVLDLGLFRRDEHLALETVAEVPAPSENPGTARRDVPDLTDVIQFHHRIADTAPVESRSFPVPPRRSRRLMAIVPPIYIALLIAFFALDRYVVKEGEFRFVATVGGQPVEMRPRASLDNTVTLRDPAPGIKKTMTLPEFQALSPAITIGPAKTGEFIVSLMLLVAGSALLLYLPMLIEWRRARRYRRLLGLTPDDASSSRPRPVA